MDYFPLFIKLKDRCALIVGGGDIAAGKATTLAKACGKVRMLAPEFRPDTRALQEAGMVELVQGHYSVEALDGVDLVIAATDQAAVNHQVFHDAEARGIPVNVVDDPGFCRFIFPSIIDRSPLLIALSSGGTAPVLLRLLRTRLESLIPAAYGKLAELSSRLRGYSKQLMPDWRIRRRFWEDMFEGEVGELALSGRSEQAEQALLRHLDSSGERQPRGMVYLIGAGPGDPDLLTFKAVRLMQKADVVLYDRLVSPGVLELIRRDAKKVYVGKKAGLHSLPQEDITQALIEYAQQGRQVVRLKGGDPFIFGRGGEEIEGLIDHDISFQVVPGITAASGAASYCGIPLTHRDYAQSVVFATGHLRDGSVDLNWPALVQPKQTLALYMGLKGLPEIARQLVQHGMAETTPVAAVHQASGQDQRLVVGQLADIAKRVEQAKLTSPSLIIVGDVVCLHQRLNWYRQSETAGDFAAA